MLCTSKALADFQMAHPPPCCFVRCGVQGHTQGGLASEWARAQLIRTLTQAGAIARHRKTRQITVLSVPLLRQALGGSQPSRGRSPSNPYAKLGALLSADREWPAPPMPLTTPPVEGSTVFVRWLSITRRHGGRFSLPIQEATEAQLAAHTSYEDAHEARVIACLPGNCFTIVYGNDDSNMSGVIANVALANLCVPIPPHQIVGWPDFVQTPAAQNQNSRFRQCARMRPEATVGLRMLLRDAPQALFGHPVFDSS